MTYEKCQKSEDVKTIRLGEIFFLWLPLEKIIMI